MVGEEVEWWLRAKSDSRGAKPECRGETETERQRSRDLKCSPEAKGLGKKGRWDSCRGGGQGQQGKRGGGWEHKGRRRRDVGRSPAALSGRLPLLS